MNTEIIRLVNNCKFHYGDREEAWYKGYDDSAWDDVILPHDYSVTAPFSEEYSSGTGYLRGGIAWYRIYVRIPQEYRGKRLTLVFDGIYNNSYVWVNSYFMGKRPFGYTEISYDISEQASFGDDLTEISVKVAHTDIADSRWFTGSGITRKAYIIVSEKVTTDLHSVFFKTASVKKDGEKITADVTVDYEILCDDKDVAVKSLLLDAAGNSVLEFTGKISASGTGKDKLCLSGTVDSPRLWSIENPYLYTLKTYLTVDGSEYLTDEERVGIRTFAFDPNTGFTLNLVPTKFKGVCVHHDGGCLGAAMRKEVWARRLELLKKSGCNAIRCSHNPHMPELYDLCDEMGFLMMDEAFDEWENPKNKWSTGHNVYPPRLQGYFEDFPAWHEKDLRTMVRRDRNHPSIVLYSIGNEIDYPNDPYCHPLFSEMTGNNDKNKPAKERQYDANKPNMERLAVIAKELIAIVKNEDDSRPVTLAAAFPELSVDIGFIDELDVVGYNYKEHLYEKDHKRFPNKTFLGSENGHSLQAWKAVEDNNYICGQFLWTGIDYLGEAHGWPIHGAGAGFITSAGFAKKELGERAKLWGGAGIEDVRPTEEISVELWKPEGKYAEILNDSREIGYYYQVIVKAPFDGPEKMSWNGKCPEECGECRCPEKEIKAQVIGAGELAGMDNGDMSDLTPFYSNTRMTFNGNLVIYIRRTSDGPIKLIVNGTSELELA
ncbi:MAG: glycoside hydrolase family 2 [Butyrivibrio sp.]|nr:glycoside hydrolase family 2 [Butyrivibrio sp.]